MKHVNIIHRTKKDIYYSYLTRTFTTYMPEVSDTSWHQAEHYVLFKIRDLHSFDIRTAIHDFITKYDN